MDEDLKVFLRDNYENLEQMAFLYLLYYLSYCAEAQRRKEIKMFLSQQKHRNSEIALIIARPSENAIPLLSTPSPLPSNSTQTFV